MTTRAETESSSASIIGRKTRQGIYSPESIQHRSPLVARVNNLLSEHIRIGGKVKYSNGGAIGFFETSSFYLTRKGVPQPLKRMVAQGSREMTAVRVLSRGYGLVPDEFVMPGVEPSVSVELVLFPRSVYTSARSPRIEPARSIRLAEVSGQEPSISMTGEDMVDQPVSYDARIVNVISRMLSTAREKWGVEDYVRVLQNLASGKMKPEEFKKFVDEPQRFACEKLKGQRRQSGEPTYEHSYRAVRNLMQAGHFVPNDLAIESLHDVFEDNPELAQDGKPYFPWREKTKQFITDMYNEEIAAGILGLTRPRPDGVDILTEDQAHELYLVNWIGHPLLPFLKLPERLDNVETLGAMSWEKQRKTVIETIDKHLPRMTRPEVMAINPKASRILLARLITALERLGEIHEIKVPQRYLVLRGPSGF